ncbi:A/G-specific adenine glycosylase [bacterium]|nr:A/G-specific adenine glycosylase [bacterium]
MKKPIAIRRALLNWFRKNKRALPWRQTKEPYRIWISEIMLQQTRVEAVIGYYHRFLEAFPTIHALARAKEDHVLKLWEGLGYYSRARNLHRAAKIVVNDQNGEFPDTLDTIQALPGIGKYTAAAIGSIAHGLRAPVLDGNVKRVVTRLYAVEAFIEQAKTTEKLYVFLDAMLSPRSPGDFNEAVMELGARVCLPRKPKCAECPIRKHCEAFAQGRPQEFPFRKPKKPIPHHEVVAAAIKKNGRYLLGKRPSSHMLGGLWEFPGGKVEEGETHKQALKRELKEEVGIKIRVHNHLVSVNHAYSHYSVTLHLYLCEHLDGKPQPLYHAALKWIPKSQLKKYPFPAANIKFFPHLC